MMRTHARQGSWAFLLAGQIVVIVLGLAVPALGPACAVLVVVVTAASLVLSSSRHGAVHRWALLGLTAGSLLFVAGEGVRPLVDGQRAWVSLLPQALELPAFALLIWAPIRMGRTARDVNNRHRHLDFAAAMDGALMAVGATACVVSLLVLPALEGSATLSWGRWVALFYPMVDVVFILAVTYLAFVSRPGLIARRLLLAAATSLFAGDIAQSWALAHGEHAAWASAPYILGFALLGSSALHPSVADLGFGGPRQSQTWSKSRVVILASGLLAPAVLLVVVPNHGPQYRVTYAITVAVGSMLVLTRAVRAINDYARTHNALRLQAERDSLTGLANRVAFMDRVQALLDDTNQHGGSVSVLFVDLDGFKPINDTRGHATGDALLVEVAHRLTGALRSDDFAARIGGDEFALVTIDDAQGSIGERLARRVHGLFAEPFSVGALTVSVSASIGMSNTEQTDVGGRTPGHLVGAADAAMYGAKRAGANQWMRAGTAANATGGAGVLWSPEAAMSASSDGRWGN